MLAPLLLPGFGRSRRLFSRFDVNLKRESIEVRRLTLASILPESRCAEPLVLVERMRRQH